MIQSPPFTPRSVSKLSSVDRELLFVAKYGHGLPRGVERTKQAMGSDWLLATPMWIHVSASGSLMGYLPIVYTVFCILESMG